MLIELIKTTLRLWQTKKPKHILLWLYHMDLGRSFRKPLVMSPNKW